jgi:hypothetical protein
MELGGLALGQRSARVPRPLGSAQASVEADRRLIEGPRASTAELASRTADKAFSTRFRPGQSGNPSGQSRLYHECRKLARQASPEMMQELIELARTIAELRTADAQTAQRLAQIERRQEADMAEVKGMLATPLKRREAEPAARPRKPSRRQTKAAGAVR